MMIDQDVLDQLCSDTGESRVQRAKVIKKLGKVKILKSEYIDEFNFEISGEVEGTQIYQTHILIKNGELEDVRCECEDYYSHYGMCKHSLATVMQFNFDVVPDERKSNDLEKILGEVGSRSSKYRNFTKIVNTFYNEELENIKSEEAEIKNKGTIVLEPKIIYEKFSENMKVEFKVGNKRMYKLKNLADFYTLMMNEEFYKYGEKLSFIHDKEMFDEDSKKLLDFVLKYAEIIKYTNSNSNSNYRYYGKALSESSIVLGNSGIDDLFEILNDKKVQFQRDYQAQIIEFKDINPSIEFDLKRVSEDEYILKPNVDIFKISIIKGKKYKYVLDDTKLYRCSKEFANSNLKLLEMFRQNYMQEIFLGKEELSGFFSIIVPKVKSAIKIEDRLAQELEEYRAEELLVKVFLDYDSNDYIIADVKFCYGNNEFNPLDEDVKIEFPRNMIAETKCFNAFRKTGFMIDIKNLKFILPEEEKIYEFITQDISYYMQKFEVLVTENFKAKEIKHPKIGSLGVKIENNLLSMNLSDLNIDIDELQEIMQKYSQKKKYHRLKDGSFVELEKNDEIEFLDKLVNGMDLDYKELEKGEVSLPVHRSLYLNQLLKGFKGTKIIKNSEYKNMVTELDKEQIEEDAKVPEELEKVLRNYQKTGFNWLKVLDSYKFGGILADDMGLGKTIQMLSIIVDYVKNNKDKGKPSLVICPSSLTLNWKNEAEKFANSLTALVIKGTASERRSQIESISQYDIVITSYDLLKRDIDVYQEKDYNFRFAIADEAQYLKNSNTQNAKSIKQIKADTKYALTGTPIENSLAELWSIFDYTMPGYLYNYKKFKSMYEVPIVKDNDEKAMQKLKMLIEPFVLRRIKKEVLKELPEKTITVLDNEMQEEQKNIYLAYLSQAKQELANEIEGNGFERSQIKILAALTRLRQICCHPSLFIQDYNEGSSKLEQCMEILQDAISGSHKILLFSSYTSMFNIIEEELKNRNIKYSKLTGSTKVDERIELVDKFNTSDEIKVFLISLKAGGTGLNLTGADMVIHYDPWWNISAENQATDRAYRIGQKNNVQVYKLITKNTIEEKIYELQQKKAELIDNMLDTKTSFVNKLSKEEIMNLFE